MFLWLLVVQCLFLFIHLTNQNHLLTSKAGNRDHKSHLSYNCRTIKHTSCDLNSLWNALFCLWSRDPFVIKLTVWGNPHHSPHEHRNVGINHTGFYSSEIVIKYAEHSIMLTLFASSFTVPILKQGKLVSSLEMSKKGSVMEESLNQTLHTEE